MTAGRKRFPRQWFGWNVRETDAFLRKLEGMLREETEQAEARIRELAKSIEELRQRVEEHKRRKPAGPDAADKLSLLLERLDRSVEAIERQGEAEAESLRLLQERKRAVHERQMTEWEKESEAYRLALDFLLKEAAGLIEKAKQMPGAGPEATLEREAREAMQVQADQLAAREEEEARRDEEEAAADLAQAEAGSSAKILQFKLRSILNEAAGIRQEEQPSESPMTADGMFMQGDSDAGPPSKTTGLKLPKSALKSPSSSSFWGDIDDFLEDPDAATERLPEAAAESPAPRETMELSGETPANQGQPVSMDSPGLSDEIVSLQNRYIVGKIAGENLYAADGRLIIAKGQTISAETVQAADREGRLPDLIVHMVIPGLGNEA